MIKIGLTGTRFSGKDEICNYFKKIGIPIFDVDTIIKFILTYNWELKSKIRKEVGNEIFEDDYISIKKLNEYRNFNQVLETIEEEIFFAYSNFNKRNKENIYSIFNCSILFEQKWNMEMDYSISVYAPFTERIERAKSTYGRNITKINSLLNKETSELEKNKVADFVIHNYGKSDVFKQIHDIDQTIIDNYLKLEKEQLVF
jgi:dephospho-CoA kinase